MILDLLLTTVEVIIELTTEGEEGGRGAFRQDCNEVAVSNELSLEDPLDVDAPRLVFLNGRGGGGEEVGLGRVVVDQLL